MSSKKTGIRRARKTLTDAEKAARDAAAEQLSAAADAALEDPAAAGAQVVEAGMRSATLATVSVRNLMMLLSQAEKRGMVITDVDTYRGWQARGRQVRRGQVALSMVTPISKKNDDTDASTTAPAAEPATGAGTDDRPMFRILGRWFDISQTDAATDENGEPVEAPEVAPRDSDDAACEVYASLKLQAERAGYLVTTWPGDEPHSEPVGVDHEAHTIDVYEPEDDSDEFGAVVALQMLAEQVALITRDRTRDRAARKETRRQAPAVLTLSD